MYYYKFNILILVFFNYDEIPFMIDPSKNTTINIKGSREILLKKCSRYQEVFTCCMLISSNGEVGPNLLIFKSSNPKTYNRIEKVDDHMYVTFNRRGWMNNELFECWYYSLYKKTTENYPNHKSVLICDSAPSHLKLNKKDILFIPKGATYLIQPIDVCIGKPYKDLVRKKFQDFFTKNHNNLTKSGMIVKPKIPEIINMHQQAYKELKKDIIRKSFKVTGYTLNIDGSENHILSYKLKSEEDIFRGIANLLGNKNDYTYGLIDDLHDVKENLNDQKNINIEESNNSNIIDDYVVERYESERSYPDDDFSDQDSYNDDGY